MNLKKCQSKVLNLIMYQNYKGFWVFGVLIGMMKRSLLYQLLNKLEFIIITRMFLINKLILTLGLILCMRYKVIQ